MIAKSDLIILVASASALAIGIYRWQSNIAPPANTTAPPSVASTPADTAPDSTADDRSAERSVLGALDATDPTGTDGIGTTDTAPVVRRVSASGTGTDRAVEARVAATGTPGTRPAGNDGTGPAPTRATPGADGALYGSYTVRQGDYLSALAQRFGTTVESLRTINGIEGNLILVGQRLQYPLPAN